MIISRVTVGLRPTTRCGDRNPVAARYYHYPCCPRTLTSAYAGDADRPGRGAGRGTGWRNSSLGTKLPLVRAANELPQQEDEVIVFTATREPDGQGRRTGYALESHTASTARHATELGPTSERCPPGADPL